MTSKEKDERKESKDFLKDPQGTNWSEFCDDNSSTIHSFEFSSPISSIGSNSSEIEQVNLSQALEDVPEYESNDYISLEEIKSQIFPPSESSNSHSCASRVDVLETIYEDCEDYIHCKTPPMIIKLKKLRGVDRIVSNFEEPKNFKKQ